MILCLGATPTVQRTMEFNRVTLDEVNRAALVTEYASGKSINAAKVAHALGDAVLATGFLGGESGRFIREQLDTAGIAHEFVEVRSPTRTCITVIDRHSQQATELVQNAAAVEMDDYAELLKVIANRAAQARAVVLSGSLPPGAPPDFYCRCLRSLPADTIPTVVDASGEALRLAAAERPSVVKPNRAELCATLGRAIATEADLRRAILDLLDLGPRTVVVTLGRDGAVACDGRAFWRIRVPAVEAISPIGSGDAFAAGLAVGMVRGMDLPEAARLAAASGVANAMTPLAGLVRPRQVEELLDRVDLQAW